MASKDLHGHPFPDASRRAVAAALVSACFAMSAQAASSTVETVRDAVGWSTYHHLPAVNGLAVSADGVLWAATCGGAYRWELRTGIYERVSPDPGEYWWVTLAPDQTPWFASIQGNGAGHYEPAKRRWTRFTRADGLPSDRVFAVAQAASGEIWFSTDHGAARFDGTHWTAFAAVDGLATEPTDALVRVASELADLLALLGQHIPFDAQTSYYRLHEAAPSAVRSHLAPLGHRLGFTGGTD